MFLAIDIGNSVTKVAVWDGELWSQILRFPSANTVPNVWTERLGTLVPHGTPSGICSVVPHLTDAIAEGVRAATGAWPTLISARIKLPFTMGYQTPETLGADRIAAAASAWLRFGRSKDGKLRPTIALDAGTAVTIDVVAVKDDRPIYLGGAIAPGPALMLDALTKGAKQLPAISLGSYPKSIGNTTYRSIESGIMLGFLEMTSGLLERICGTQKTIPKVVVTGGWSAWLVDCGEMYQYTGNEGVNAPGLEWEPELVLDGVRLLCELQ